MKQLILGACLILCVAGDAFTQDQTSTTPITIDELNQRPVIGELGVALGTPTEIDALVVSGRDTRRKGYNSLYLLKVTHVDGKKLDSQPTLRFSTPLLASANLANHTFKLYELKNGKKAGSLNSSQVAELEKGYVGKSVRLVVYEVGAFGGIPKKLPDDVRVWADFGFNFSTSLTVLAERDNTVKRD